MIIREDNYYDTKWFEEGFFPILNNNEKCNTLNEDVNYFQLNDISYLSESNDTHIFSLDYQNLENLCEKYDLDYSEAIDLLCENNQVDHDSIVINIKDYDLIENPYLLEDVECNYAISEISDCSFEYLMAEQCLFNYLNGDENAFDIMLEDADAFIDYIIGEDAHARRFRNKRLIGKSIDRAGETNSDISVPNANDPKVQQMVNDVRQNKVERAYKAVERAKKEAKKESKKNQQFVNTNSLYTPHTTISSILSRATGKGSNKSLPDNEKYNEFIKNSPRVKKAESKYSKTLKAVGSKLSKKIPGIDPKYNDNTSIKHQKAMKIYNSILGRTSKHNIDFDSSIDGRIRKGEHGENLEGRISKNQSGLFMPVKRKFHKLTGKGTNKRNSFLPVLSNKNPLTTTSSGETKRNSFLPVISNKNPLTVIGTKNSHNNDNEIKQLETPSQEKRTRKLKKLIGVGKIKNKSSVSSSLSSTGDNNPLNKNSSLTTGDNNPLNTNSSLMSKNKNLIKYGKYGLAAAGIAGAVFAANKFAKQAKNKPRTWIARKIAALRSVYHKFMTQAQRNPQKAGALKRIAAKILAVIDKLMAKLQNATN